MFIWVGWTPGTSQSNNLIYCKIIIIIISKSPKIALPDFMVMDLVIHLVWVVDFAVHSPCDASACDASVCGGPACGASACSEPCGGTYGGPWIFPWLLMTLLCSEGGILLKLLLCNIWGGYDDGDVVANPVEIFVDVLTNCW